MQYQIMADQALQEPLELLVGACQEERWQCEVGRGLQAAKQAPS